MLRFIENWLSKLRPDDLAADTARRERIFELLKQTVTDFVSAQIELDPNIEPRLMRDQLIRILGDQYHDRSADGSEGSPYVYRPISAKNANPAVLGLVYSDDVHSGLGGSRMIVESYVIENGKARLVGRGGTEMDKYSLNAKQVWNPAPNTTSILVHGMLQWASGHELPAKSVLYRISTTGVKAIWTFASPGLRLLGSEVRYL